MKSRILACLMCLLVLPSLRAEERYLVVLFASQDASGSPRRAHTFATFLKVEIGEPDADGVIPTETLESTTISWLPVTGNIRLLARSEPGRNFGLQESLAWAKEHGMQTTARGPFEIGKKLYERAVEQKAWLDSGEVAYKALDRRFRRGGAVNCIHAVSDLIPGPLLSTGAAYGDDATELVTQHLRPQLVDPDRTHVWALRHLELNGERIAVQNEPGGRALDKPVFAE